MVHANPTTPTDHLARLINYSLDLPNLRTEVVRLLEKIQGGGEAAKLHLDDWMNVLLASVKTRVRRGPQVEVSMAGNKRARDYRLCQELYKKDRKQLAAVILDGALYSQREEGPETQTVEKTYSSLFEEESPVDNELFKMIGEVREDLLLPITIEEIKTSIKDNKSRTVGPDGWSVRDVIGLCPGTISVLANAMFYLVYVPARLKENRTILIPKNKEDSKNINNYRPIIISSIFLRIINKIWAKRLGGLRTWDE